MAVDFAPSVLASGGTSNWTSVEAWTRVMRPNLEQMERVLSALQLADSSCLVVFPEDALFGPVFPTRASITPFLEPLDVGRSRVLQFVAQVARRMNVHIVLCMGELASGGKQFNTAVAVGPTGTVLGAHRKRHLYFEPQWDQGPAEQQSWFMLASKVGCGSRPLVRC